MSNAELARIIQRGADALTADLVKRTQSLLVTNTPFNMIRLYPPPLFVDSSLLGVDLSGIPQAAYSSPNVQPPLDRVIQQYVLAGSHRIPDADSVSDLIGTTAGPMKWSSRLDPRATLLQLMYLMGWMPGNSVRLGLKQLTLATPQGRYSLSPQRLEGPRRHLRWAQPMSEPLINHLRASHSIKKQTTMALGSIYRTMLEAHPGRQQELDIFFGTALHFGFCDEITERFQLESPMGEIEQAGPFSAVISLLGRSKVFPYIDVARALAEDLTKSEFIKLFGRPQENPGEYTTQMFDKHRSALLALERTYVTKQLATESDEAKALVDLARMIR